MSRTETVSQLSNKVLFAKEKFFEVGEILLRTRSDSAYCQCVFECELYYGEELLVCTVP